MRIIKFLIIFILPLLSYSQDNREYGMLNNKGETIVPFDPEIKNILLYKNSPPVFIKEYNDGYREYAFIKDNGTLSNFYDFFYPEFTTSLAVAEKEDKFGIVNYNGNQISEFLYDKIIPYNSLDYYIFGEHYRYVPAQKNGKWGIIDTLGKEISLFEYDEPLRLIELVILQDAGMTYVKKNNKWGIIDTAKNELTSFIYDEIIWIDGKRQFYAQKNGKWGIAESNGKEVTSFEYDNMLMPEIEILESKDEIIFYVSKSDKWGVLDHTGKEVLPCIFEEPIYRGISVNERFFNKNGKWGVFNVRTGAKIVDLKYDILANLDSKHMIAKKDFRWGIIDINEKPVVPFEYDTIKRLIPIIAKLDKGSQIAIFNSIEKKIIPLEYDNVKVYQNVVLYPYGLEVTKNGKTGFIDIYGKEIIAPVYDDIEDYLKYGIILKKDGKWGVLDTLGNDVISFIYDKIDNKYNLYICKKNGTWGAFDHSGKEVIPFLYDSIAINQSLDPKLLIEARKHGKWGIVDTLQREISQFYYDEIIPISLYNRTIVKVRNNEKWGLINSITGDEIAPAVYSDIPIKFNRSGDHHYIKVIDGYKEGILDTLGRELIPVDHHFVNIYNNIFLVEKNNMWGAFNRQGIRIIPTIYDSIEAGEEVIILEKDGYYGAVDKEGKEILPFKYAKLKTRGSYIIAERCN